MNNVQTGTDRLQQNRNIIRVRETKAKLNSVDSITAEILDFPDFDVFLLRKPLDLAPNTVRSLQYLKLKSRLASDSS